MSLLKSRIQGCLMGVMLGDALGMPVEMMSREEILAQTHGMGITGFIYPIQRKISDTQSLPAGSTTDDWQLTKAFIQSLLRRKSFDLYDIALSHVEAYEQSQFGWGRITKSGLEQLKLYFDSRGNLGRGPYHYSHTEILKNKDQTIGNGLAMKIAPLAIWQVVMDEDDDNELLWHRIYDLAGLTHPCEIAVQTAGALVLEIMFNLRRDIWTHSQSSSDMSIEDLVKIFGNSSKAIESVYLAREIFFHHSSDFRAGVLEAVNAGGDTDTIASMVGAMIGANVGLDGIPKEWIAFNPKFQEAIDLGTELFQLKKNNLSIK